jgi:hypothetical protein
MEQWKNRLAHFEDMPVVNFFGIVSSGLGGGWGTLEGRLPFLPEDMGSGSLDFDVWRVEGNSVQTTHIGMTALISYQEWNFLKGFTSSPLRASSIVHLKAKIARNEAGFQEALFVEYVGTNIDDEELSELRRQLIEPVILNSPPLPPLQLSTYSGSWDGRTALSSWYKFSIEPASQFRPERLGGFPLKIESAPLPAVMLDYRGVSPSPEQVAAYAYLIEKEEDVQNAALQSISDHYPQWQEDYGVDEELMPNVINQEQFQSLIQLQNVFITSEAKEGYAYLYLSFDPLWDTEHGIGAVLHKDRVVAIGDHGSIWDAAQKDRESN